MAEDKSAVIASVPLYPSKFPELAERLEKITSKCRGLKGLLLVVHAFLRTEEVQLGRCVSMRGSWPDTRVQRFREIYRCLSELVANGTNALSTSDLANLTRFLEDSAMESSNPL